MSDTETVQRPPDVCLPKMFSCRPDAVACTRYKAFGSRHPNFVVGLRGYAR